MCLLKNRIFCLQTNKYILYVNTGVPTNFSVPVSNSTELYPGIKFLNARYNLLLGISTANHAQLHATSDKYLSKR